MGFNPGHEWRKIKNALRRSVRPRVNFALNFARNPRHRLKRWQRSSTAFGRELKSYWDNPNGRWVLAGVLGIAVFFKLYGMWWDELIAREKEEASKPLSATELRESVQPGLNRYAGACMRRTFDDMAKKGQPITHPEFVAIQADCEQIAHYVYLPRDMNHPEADARVCFLTQYFNGTLLSEEDVRVKQPGDAVLIATQCRYDHPLRPMKAAPRAK